MFSAVASVLMGEFLRASGRRTKPTTIEGVIPMSAYDLVGVDPVDILGDDFGGIGADLIGDDEDEALLEALAVSGDDDDDWDDDDWDDDDEELIAGAGDSEIVGARRRRRRRARGKKSARRRAAMRKLVMRNAGAVMRRGLDRRRRYPQGFLPTTVASGASVAVPAAPQNLFRPERLIIPSDIAFDTGVQDIKVGNQSQLVQSVEVPGAVFSEVAIDTNVTFDTAEVGNQVSVQIRNKSGQEFEFSAALVGTIAK